MFFLGTYNENQVGINVARHRWETPRLSGVCVFFLLHESQQCYYFTGIKNVIPKEVR